MIRKTRNSSDTRHLDLGCGNNPRNPYGQAIVHGIDIGEYHGDQDVNYTRCNVIYSVLPFHDSTFDSVSAYDFIEHIPRLISIDGAHEYPFIHVMNEIFRVLKPDGKFYALTPAYPKESAYVDPTHVNIITKNTHKYFTEPHNWAYMYGFKGKFRVLRAQWCYFRNETEPMSPLEFYLKTALCKVYRKMMQHFLWEFQAIK